MEDKKVAALDSMRAHGEYN